MNLPLIKAPQSDAVPTSFLYGFGNSLEQALRLLILATIW
jgi:hypothetical protein